MSNVVPRSSKHRRKQQMPVMWSKHGSLCIGGFTIRQSGSAALTDFALL